MKKNTLFSFAFLLSALFTQAQSELLGVELGQFFEQGYGAELNEEAMDLTGFPSLNHVIVGWSERPFEAAETTPGGSIPGTQLDASVWFTDKIGSLQYETHYGSIFYDEVATGVAALYDDEYAICIHRSPDYQGHVEDGDDLIVNRLDNQGGILWSYTHPSEEGSYAPVDIYYAEDLNVFYILANKTYGAFNGGTHSIALIQLDDQGNFVWEQEHQAYEHNQITATELVQYNETSLMTVANNTNGNYPEFIYFDMLNPSSSSTPFPHSTNVFLYGIDFDNKTDEFYSAGYTIGDESDLNALIWTNAMDASFVKDYEVGIAGTEKFKDVTLTSSGFVAGGIRNNKGEGGDDVFVAHFDDQGNLTLEETMGGVTNDRFNSFWLDPFTNDYTFFAGYDEEYGIEESGNAYIGGIVSKPIAPQITCILPRFYLVDNLIDPNHNPIGLNNVSNIIADAQRLKMDAIVLFDVDRIFNDKINGGPNGNTAGNLTKLANLITLANTNNIKVGIVVGPSINLASTIADVLSNLHQASVWNFNTAGKINFMMLEHEFWNAKDAPTLLWPFNYSPVSNPSFVGFNKNPYNISGATTSDKEAFYDQLWKDHFRLIDFINDRKVVDGNLWKALDYISSPFNNDAPNPSSNSGQGIADWSHRQNIIDLASSKSDAVLVAYYQTDNRPTWQPYDWALNQPNEMWFTRLKQFGSAVGGSAKIIPLFSAEESSVNNCGTQDFLGKWMSEDPNHDVQFVEDQMVNQYNQFLTTNDIVNNCSSCSSTIQHVGFGYFKFTCLKQFNQANVSKALCSNINNGGVISQAEFPTSLETGLSIYPNPAVNAVQVKNNTDASVQINIYDVYGKLTFQHNLEKLEHFQLDISSYSTGIYFITFNGFSHKFIKL